MSRKKDMKLLHNLFILGVISFIFCISVLTVPIFEKTFQPIPWLTLIIGGTFGLGMALIVNSKSEQILIYLELSEDERQESAFRNIQNNIVELINSTNIFLKTTQDTNTLEKRRVLSLFLPRFKILIALCQSTIPSLGNKITTAKLEKLEKNLNLLNDLISILEIAKDDKFENMNPKLSIYCKHLDDALKE